MLIHLGGIYQPGAGHPGRGSVVPHPRKGLAEAASALDEERREVFDSVLRAMSAVPPDSDRSAACSYLLQHLERTVTRG